jgi:hypothetical protein
LFSKFHVAIFASFLVLSWNACAEWVEIDSSANRAFSMFYDATSISKKGEVATIKILKNFKEPRNSVDPDRSYKFLSQSSTQQINCATHKYRQLEISMWSEKNASGKMEQLHDYSKKLDWGQRVSDDSIESLVISEACN